jgi:eukaryotic-like serine/threonine-protein kinase
MGLQTGQRLGGFEVLGPLGSGGMGEVYRARDTRLGREVALKVLPDSVAADRARLSRFEQEARAASALNHPHIVTIHEIGRAGDVTFIAMELVDGKTLRELSAPGPMPMKKVLNVGAQISDGLAKAHGVGIVHRDLKPENVMVSKDGFVKILDFGLAKLSEPPPGQLSAMPTAVTPQTTAGTVLGTVAYMSPEQASGEPVDYRSDQFSLGSMLYEISTGKSAFQRKTAAETMSAIIREEPEPAGRLRPDLPLPLRWMLERCLAKDKEERYASTRDLARDLASVRDHISEVSSGSEVLLASTGKPRRRFALPVVLAALVAGLAAGWVLTRARSGPPRAAPSFTRLTFRRGALSNARFSPDGKTIVYGARWAGDPPATQLFRLEVGRPESAPFAFASDILAISPSNELAILDVPPGVASALGTLSLVPMSSGAPRQVLENVGYAGADFSPDGKDLAVDHTVGDQSRLEFPIGKVIYPNAVGSPRVSRDGRSIAFWSSEAGAAGIKLVGRDGGTARALTRGWASFAGAPCWSPDGREIWFSASKPGETDSLWAVELSGKVRSLLRAPGALELDDVSRDGKMLVGHHTLIRTVRYGSAAAPEPRDLAWLNDSALDDISADGKYLLLTERGAGSGVQPVIYLRRTDGSPAVKIGEGLGRSLSPDGKWVLAYDTRDPKTGPRYVVLPTGPGERKEVDPGGFSQHYGGVWLPDGKRIVFAAVAEGKPRLYVQSLDGKPVAVGPEDTEYLPFPNLSPDGKYVAGVHGGQATLIPLDGEAARPIPNISVETSRVVGWTSDSRGLYVWHRGERLAKVWLHNVVTGQARVWKEFPVEDTLGIVRLRVSPDGAAWAVGGVQSLSELYLVDGVR